MGVTLLSLLVALVGLLLVIQYLATRQILEWHRQRVELVARLVLAEYQGKIQRCSKLALIPLRELRPVATPSRGAW
jgi:hypothetical protein